MKNLLNQLLSSLFFSIPICLSISCTAEQIHSEEHTGSVIEYRELIARERTEEESAYIVVQIEKEVKNILTDRGYDRNLTYKERKKIIDGALQTLDNLPIANPETKVKRQELVAYMLAELAKEDRSRLLNPQDDSKYKVIPLIKGSSLEFEGREIFEGSEILALTEMERVLLESQRREREQRRGKEIEVGSGVMALVPVSDTRIEFKSEFEESEREKRPFSRWLRSNSSTINYTEEVALLQKIAQAQERDLATHNHEANDLQKKLTQHEVDLTQKKEALKKHAEKLQEQKNELETSNKVLEHTQSKLSNTKEYLQTIEQQLLDEEKARKQTGEQLQDLQQKNTHLASKAKAYRAKNRKMRTSLLKDFQQDLLDKTLSKEEKEAIRTQIQALEDEAKHSDQEK